MILLGELYVYGDGTKWIPLESVHEFIGIKDGGRQVLSFIGGGGKTSTIFRMAKELAGLDEAGKHLRILVTTTTKMQIPDEGCVLLSPSVKKAVNSLETEPYVVAGRPNPPKMSGLEPRILSAIMEHADVVLIEADGARGLPLKAPAEHEPVLVPQTTKVVAVMGLDCLGEELGKVCHRPESVARILQTDWGHRITPQDAAVLLTSPEGQQKDLTERLLRGFYVILNKADDRKRLEEALLVADELYGRGCSHIAAACNLYDRR